MTWLPDPPSPPDLLENRMWLAVFDRWFTDWSRTLDADMAAAGARWERERAMKEVSR